MKKSKFESYLAEQLENHLSANTVEIEQKYRIKDPQPIRQRLRKLGAKKGIAGTEHNELFDIENTLRKRKQILRLRYHGKEKAWLTFKGPRQKGAIKRRMEIETPVFYEPTKRILELLGYRVIASYRKYREEYELTDGKVCLDHLPGCGWFVEIEGKVRAIHRIARLLQLEKDAKEHRSYRKLLRERPAAVIS